MCVGGGGQCLALGGVFECVCVFGGMWGVGIRILASGQHLINWENLECASSSLPTSSDYFTLSSFVNIKINFSPSSTITLTPIKECISFEQL